jgi:flagellar biosynthetic protein FliR
MGEMRPLELETLMNSLFPISLDWIWSVMWALLRVSGFFVAAPFWGHRSIPRVVKVPIALILAFSVAPIVSGMAPVAPDSLWTAGGWAVREVVTGGLIGFGFATIFWAVRMAGDLVGLQMGFAIVNVIDPNQTEQVSLIGEFKYILATLIMFIIDGHHLMIAALVDSYRLIPLGLASFNDDALNTLIRLTATVFVTAIKIGAPVMITLLLTDVALGIVARTVPQMNIFIVGFPVKIGIGFLVLGAGLPLLAQLFSRSFSELQIDTQRLIAALAIR